MTIAGPARARLSAALERVGQGDQPALHTVYELTSAKLFGICLHLLGDRELAEDVLQEVYLKVWQNARNFDPQRASPITWLCMIARNRAIDWRRATGRYDSALHGAAGVASEPVVEPQDQYRTLHRCLEGLQDNMQASIRSAFLDGFTYAELAKRAEVPLGTMKSWVRRGLSQLKECIDDA